MTINETIAKWLGLNYHKYVDGMICQEFPYGYGDLIDFFRNYNQQKWIKNKLIELGYKISITISKRHDTVIHIWSDDEITEVWASNELENLAFIEASMQLIEKMNKNQDNGNK